jgi:hypothetical protein
MGYNKENPPIKISGCKNYFLFCLSKTQGLNPALSLNISIFTRNREFCPLGISTKQATVNNTGIGSGEVRSLTDKADQNMKNWRTS